LAFNSQSQSWNKKKRKKEKNKINTQETFKLIPLMKNKNVKLQKGTQNSLNENLKSYNILEFENSKF